MTPAEVKQTLLANVQHEWSCEVHPRNIETATSFRGRQGKSPHCTCKVGKAIKEAEDMVLVPREPTKEMVQAWSDSPSKLIISNAGFKYRYKSMIEAANESKR